MNIVSVMVGMSLMGVAAPQIANMSIQPFVAQKRALNFGQAEAAAVSYAAANEYTEDDLPEPPAGCSNQALDDEGLSWEITCRAGVDTQFEQVVSRSFRVMPLSNQPPANGEGEQTGDNNSGRTYQFVMPGDFSGHQCTSSDPWGVNGWWNSTYPTLAACVPDELRTRQAYLDSNPDDWYYDASTYGWGDHPDY
jgi:hypothetical protein